VRDRFGNEHAPGLPYARGELLRGTEDDVAKLRAAWEVLRNGRVFNFTGLERSLDLGDAPAELLDDELAAATYADRLRELALDHLGGVPGRDDAFVANRATAAIVAALQVLVRPGDTVVGVSAGYSHPCVGRAVRLAGGELVDTVGRADFEQALERVDPALVVLTRLAVTYEALPGEDLEPIVAAARARGAAVFVDDAGGARVGPAVFGQPRTLELGGLRGSEPQSPLVGATGLDKYGTSGPRLGLLAGPAEVVGRIRARAIELGLEARPLLYPAVVRSLERYRPERVRELVRTTESVGEALAGRLGDWITRTPVAVRLDGEAVLAEVARRAGLAEPPLVPIEATAALAMALLRDHGILTVHFAALPPGTAGLLVKFVQPETLERFGGPDAFAAAVDASLDEVARVLAQPAELRALLGVPS
jgi:L-seryl-tRNA(Ser) seleniumtransferase